MDITGSVVAKSLDNIELYDYDWKSVGHGIDIWFEKNGWEIDNSEEKYDSDGCIISYQSKQTDDGFEIGINGTCDNDYNYMDIIDSIISLLKNRHAVINGKIVLTGDIKVIVITFCDNTIITKEASFDI